ncbi:dihydroxyacetone kinase phosphoryl donor subunit DhaM [Thermoactinomyces mirandus]|uniref:phosphoenolpyruvate--glycerone phosphotransferase n=1 Tax=Thermoactinomyces mirandus TaxID=2756294 RepID=A0A7W1XUX4_9BACL|nr:dihydroxyacetone kinase phosphoryl donor subunit DhaM [Thermoactinomyces mirandus]MBA4603747.1 PTS-dependent dihydroxyacetone kinase phosphotransferase subunit DhaM [Thermoactinomyces mirandus]
MSCVGLVLVSHSEKLVEGLAEFLSQVQKQVPIAIAGGTDEGELGTSMQKIKEAIESVYSDQGVIILFDFGSASMSIEMAIEMLGPDKRIRVADAPLVEGAYAAVVQASVQSSLEKVLASAEKVNNLQKLG